MGELTFIAVLSKSSGDNEGVITLTDAILVALVERGLLGILLAGAIAMLIYTVKRFISYLESQTESHLTERGEWLETLRRDREAARDVLAEHTRVSVQMYEVLREMRDDLRRRNGH